LSLRSCAEKLQIEEENDAKMKKSWHHVIFLREKLSALFPDAFVTHTPNDDTKKSIKCRLFAFLYPLSL